jgi:putative transposase
MKNYKEELLPNETYHIFSRAIGDEKLFKNDNDYDFFLSKVKIYVLPIADIVTYTAL